jgi:hypothetical protein
VSSSENRPVSVSARGRTWTEFPSLQKLTTAHRGNLLEDAVEAEETVDFESSASQSYIPSPRSSSISCSFIIIAQDPPAADGREGTALLRRRGTAAEDLPAPQPE